MKPYKLIALSGGIGAGKSVVAEILRVKGFPVYDCDAEARRIMDSNPNIHSLLCDRIHPDCVVKGKINRNLISKIVFNNESALKTLNSIVHSAVLNHLQQWCASHLTSGETLMFVESAILHASNLINVVDEEWRVTAPQDVRIERVGKRSGLTPQQVLSRIAAQAAEEKNETGIPLYIIDNSPQSPILPQINALFSSINLNQ